METTSKKKNNLANNPNKAILYLVSGEKKYVNPQNGKKFTLEELQKFVGGYIEMGYLSDGRIMVLNEEGKLLGLKKNRNATRVYQELCYPGDYIVGNALVSPTDLID